MRLLVSGDRQWYDYEFIRDAMREFHNGPRGPIDLVIEGGARGADSLARKAARELGIEVVTFRANWLKYGHGAGHKRNQQMLKEVSSDLVWGFTDTIEYSVGTKDMLARARKAGVEVELKGH